MCDTFARVGPHGTVFAKNSDRPRHEVQVVRWHPPRPAGPELRTQYLVIDDRPALGMMLSQPTWLWGAEHGVNERGVAIGNERLFPRRALDDEPALIGMDLVRLGLERGDTADEALEVVTRLVERHGQGGTCQLGAHEPYDSSFLIADGSGGWVLETYSREWVARRFDDAVAISNRYTLDTSWTRASTGVTPGTDVDDWHDPGVDTRRADRRLAATRACVHQPDPIGPLDAIAALRDHGTGPWGGLAPGPTPVPPPTKLGDDYSGMTLCLHQPPALATTAAMVAFLPTTPDDPIRAWVALGSPCVATFTEVTLPDVPPELGQEGTWHAAAARRDHFETEAAGART